MGNTVGSFDAKTRLSEYLERASRGERFTITRRGKPIAELRPPDSGSLGLREVLGRCEDLRSRLEQTGKRFDVTAAVRKDRNR